MIKIIPKNISENIFSKIVSNVFCPQKLNTHRFWIRLSNVKTLAPELQKQLADGNISTSVKIEAIYKFLTVGIPELKLETRINEAVQNAVSECDGEYGQGRTYERWRNITKMTPGDRAGIEFYFGCIHKPWERVRWEKQFCRVCRHRFWVLLIISCRDSPLGRIL